MNLPTGAALWLAQSDFDAVDIEALQGNLMDDNPIAISAGNWITINLSDFELLGLLGSAALTSRTRDLLSALHSQGVMVLLLTTDLPVDGDRAQMLEELLN